jgi:5-hydroxyisourate hydrolase-like protein (transthyretin family)
MITTHVLDTARGVPATVEVILELRHRSDWSAIGPPRPTRRAASGLLEAPIVPGTYRMTFDIGTYPVIWA